MNNRIRANRARVALNQYAGKLHRLHVDDKVGAAKDLISDLLHYVTMLKDFTPESIDEFMDSARMNFDAETETN